jgi:hypothetical protein
MEAIKLFVERGLNDFRQAIEETKTPLRKYEKQSEYIYKPKESRFKLVVWFKDGNTRYFFSYDNVHVNKKVRIDEFEGMVKLMKLLDKYKDKYKFAIIYATLDPGRNIKSNYCYEILKRDQFNNTKTNKIVNFCNLGENNILDFKRLEVYGNKKI